MARDFDKLIEHLLDEVGLCGDEGASVDDFKSFVQAFYAEDGVAVEPNLLKKVWHWLTSHAEISVKGDVSDPELRFLGGEASGLAVPEGGTSSQPQQERASNDVERTSPSNNPEQVADTSDACPPDEQTTEDTPEDEIRIHANQARIWLALTGHGVDWKKVPPKEFELLTIIARRREAGIPQPELVRISEQDKRSVPKRTTVLADRGYILKETYAAHATRTSLLTHKRFQQRHDEPSKDAVFVDGNMNLPRFWEFLIDLLERHNVIAEQDLRRMLDVEEKRKEVRKVWRSLLHLKKLGIIDHVKARTYIDGKDMHRLLKCIRLLRTPTAKDRKAFLDYKKQEKIGQAREVVDESDGRSDRDEDEDDEEVEVTAALLDDTQLEQDAIEDETDDLTGLVAQWDGIQPVNNLLFDLVDAAGKEGMSSAQLARQSLGAAWSRPLDETISRLTDAWETSQPQHLRHLSIVRDTKRFGPRGIQFVYRSLAGQRAAVTAGEASWEGLSKTALAAAGKLLQASDLDEWGFLKPRASAFVDPSRYVSLSQCLETAKFRLESSSSEPILGVDAEGKEYVYWPEREGDSDDGTLTRTPAPRTPKPKTAYNKRTTTKGSMFEGVSTTSAEYQRLWREKQKEAKRNGAWRARAEELAEWRALRELYPDGIPAPAEEELSAKRPTRRKRGRPRKNPDPVDPGTEQETSSAAPEQTDAPASEDASTELQQPSEERIQAHLEQILARKLPGAYHGPPGSHRTDLGAYARSAVVVIRSDRLVEFDWFEASREAMTSRPDAETPQHGADETLYNVPVPEAEEAVEELADRVTSHPPATLQVPQEQDVDDAMDVDEPTPPLVVTKSKFSKRGGRRSASRRSPPTVPDVPLPEHDSNIANAAAKDTLIQQSDAGAQHKVSEAPNGNLPVQTPTISALAATSEIEQPTDAAGAVDDDVTPAADTGEDVVMVDRPGDDDVDATIIIANEVNEALATAQDPAEKAAKSKMRPKQGVLLGGGSVARIRTSILNDMLERCGGLMPGGTDLVQPFVAAFQARVPDAPTPDKETVTRAVKNLRDQGTIKFFDFPLTGRNGKRTDKRVIARLDITTKSPELRELMKRMQAAHPQPYLPTAIWEPGTLEQVRSARQLWPGQNSLARQVPKDVTATVSLLQPSEEQSRELQRKAAREERRLEQVALRAERKAEKEAKAAAKAAAEEERLQRIADGVVDENTVDPDVTPRRRRQIRKRPGIGIVDYHTPNLPPPVIPPLSRTPTYDAVTPYPIVWQPTERPGNEYMVVTNEDEDARLTPARIPNFAVQDQRMILPRPELDRNHTPVERRRRRDDNNDDEDSVATPERASKRQRVIPASSGAPYGSTPMKSVSEMSTEQQLMLLHAHVAARVLACGLDGAVNWHIIDYVFRRDPTYSRPIFKSRFQVLAKSRSGIMESIVNDFQISYLAAYEAGDVPGINYDRPEETDWNGIVQWSLQNLTLGTGSLPVLPTKQSKLERSYVLDQAQTYLGRERFRFSKTNVSETQRNDLLHDLPFMLLHPSAEDAVVGLCLKQDDANVLERLQQLRQPIDVSDAQEMIQSLHFTDWHMALMLAKAAIRADVFTPTESYDATAARDVLALFSDELSQQAAQELENNRTITRKERDASQARLPDTVRPYAVDEYFINALVGYCYIEPADLDGAVSFKARLDRAFRSGAESVSFGFDAGDGMNLATTNLVARRKIKMVSTLPPFDDTIGVQHPTISKWGWNAGEYKGAKTDQMSMEMVKLDMKPTASYEFGLPAELGSEGIFPTPPPGLSSTDTVKLYPLWIDIHGNLMVEWWRKLVCYIIQTIHLRPYIDLDQLTETFRGLIWRWEVELVLDWAQTNGLINAAGNGPGHSGSSVKEWLAGDYWWLCLAQGDEFSMSSDE